MTDDPTPTVLVPEGARLDKPTLLEGCPPDERATCPRCGALYRASGDSADQCWTCWYEGVMRAVAAVYQPVMTRLARCDPKLKVSVDQTGGMCMALRIGDPVLGGWWWVTDAEDSLSSVWLATDGWMLGWYPDNDDEIECAAYWTVPAKTSDTSVALFTEKRRELLERPPEPAPRYTRIESVEAIRNTADTRDALVELIARKWGRQDVWVNGTTVCWRPGDITYTVDDGEWFVLHDDGDDEVLHDDEFTDLYRRAEPPTPRHRCSVCAGRDEDHGFAPCPGGDWDPDPPPLPECPTCEVHERRLDRIDFGGAPPCTDPWHTAP